MRQSNHEFIHFHPENWERVERDWTAWWAGELDRPMVIIQDAGLVEGERYQGITWANTFGVILQYPHEMNPNQVLDHYQPHLEAQRYYGDAWPRWWPNFGPGVVGAFLGAQVNFSPETRTVWFNPTRRSPIQDLDLIYDLSNTYWQRVLAITQAAVERWGNQVTIGVTDLGGNLDILASMMNAEDLLFAFIDHPKEVLRLVNKLTRLWLRYHGELHETIIKAGRGVTDWAPLWSPGKYFMLQSDLSYVISPSMFERFVLPDLETCCEELDYAFYHLDGIGQIGHLDHLLSLERLRGIQWIPGDGKKPPEEWMPLLQRIRNAGKLCQLYVSPKGALRIVQTLGGRGFALRIRQPMTQEEANDYIKLLAVQDAN